MDIWPVGVFTSVGAGLGASIDAVKEMGVPTVQLHAPPSDLRTAEFAAQVKQQFDEAGIRITVVFCGFPGESYADIPTVRETVGLVPSQTRADRFQQVKAISDFARHLGVDAIGLHMGFIPEDHSDPLLGEVVDITRQLCDYAHGNGQWVHLETGQESADGLWQFIHRVNRLNLAVNFDPANMILYGSGNPIEALAKVGRYVRSVHCKDATWAARPGEEWGVETPLGEGEVNIALYLRTLKLLGYSGPLTIEREISGEQQRKDIAAAVTLLERLRAEIWS